ncbi:uncharacterized protein TRAVEDRAFT_53828 [Trametes versicolor FP-101664 SS1]|uniref:uncharacterized protein n=1 Tax=Trametes versicolor (strain FP-101664) TaxID=717944 RepID=UPI00046220ED|nr:uncharacterized protein TRAVEDRAFT_53828 [Trametes versicolor FP-101664 SS1]EIW52406.1 hypothetical protein TRAVEDRAFT_53828 [Trametes versicolor FP-101664 SS1]
MSVHPALLIEDILDEIFYYCDFIGHHGMLENATLASLALVCTTFHEPAIRVLWRELRALTPLFRLIPSCHLQDHDNHANDSQGEVVSYDENNLSDFSLHEWSRLRKYTGYVRLLYTMDYEEMKYLKLTNWPMIRRLSGGEPLLPNVRVIFWQVDESIVDGLLAFLSPSIDHLYIRCVHEQPLTAKHELEWAARIKIWIDAMTRITPRREFTVLSFDVAQLPPSLFAIPLSLAAPNLPRALQRVKLETDMFPIDLPSLTALASISNVHSLQLCEPNLSWSIWSRPPQAPGGLPGNVDFPYLQDLPIHNHPVEGPITSVISSASLRFLHIETWEYQDNATLCRTSRALAKAFPSLDSIGFVDPRCRTNPPPEPLALLDLLSPFFGHRVQDVSFASDTVAFAVGDDDLVALSRAWPMLTQLAIEMAGRAAPSSDYTVGLRGLLSLATHCASLKSLRFGRIVVLPEDVAQLPPEPPNSDLRFLWVKERLSPDDQRLISDRIFPTCVHKVLP